MHPGFIHWWKSHQHHHGCGPHADAHAACGHHGGGGFGHSGGPGAGLGVRRPLRFLAWKLELEEEQVTQLAAILETLKTERAQADVDFRRSSSALATALEAEGLDESGLADIAKQRVDSEGRRQLAVVTALSQIHAVLDPEQRKRFAYLIRTGAIQI